MNADEHRRELVVWEVPPGIHRGARFAIRVGVKCRSACAPSDWRIEVRDHEGALVAEAVVGAVAWPGTAGLFHAELALSAPGKVGRYRWTVVALPVAAAGADAGSPGHAAAQTTLGIRVEPDPDCRLTVIATDEERGAPLPGARVVVHPYQALTDERGVAELRLPAGPFRLFVTGQDRQPYRRDGELTGELTIRAALAPDRGPSEAELWA